MNWNYETKLKEYIAKAVRDVGDVAKDLTFEVAEEQAFVKMEELKPGTIYVVIKYLSTTNTLDATTQPIQILISCEQNSIQASQIVFSKLVESHNFEEIIENGTYVKQDYREPVVLSNFNQVSYGYRTLMYISATLFIMEDIIDVGGLSIKIGGNNAENVKPINFNIAYSMTPNTQPVPPDRLASSVKSLSTFSLTFSVPLSNKYNFITTLAQIMNGTVSGNTDLNMSFNLGSVPFTNIPMKVVSIQVVTAINAIPSIQIGLIK